MLHKIKNIGAKENKDSQRLEEFLLEVQFAIPDEFLEMYRKTFLSSSKINKENKGICRFCGKAIKLLKNKKHLYTHNFYYNRVCFGSRRLDYDNRNLALISENFDLLKR